MGEEYAGSKKLGLAPKVLQSLWSSAELFLQQTFYHVRPSAEPSCRTPKVPQNSGEDGGASFPPKQGQGGAEPLLGWGYCLQVCLPSSSLHGVLSRCHCCDNLSKHQLRWPDSRKSPRPQRSRTEWPFVRIVFQGSENLIANRSDSVKIVHPASKGVRQKEFGKKVPKKVIIKSDQKVTERAPKTKKSDRTPFADLLLRGHYENSFYFFLRVDSRESPQFALRIARPSKLLRTLGSEAAFGNTTQQKHQ